MLPWRRRGLPTLQRAMLNTLSKFMGFIDDKVSLEDVMISLQKANLAMQGMVQVRNRLVEAYREVMNMQV